VNVAAEALRVASVLCSSHASTLTCMPHVTRRRLPSPVSRLPSPVSRCRYDRYTGFEPGAACSTRDLVLDVHAALAKRGLRMLLYWTCDGPSDDDEASDVTSL